jgi:hypothetical protein
MKDPAAGATGLTSLAQTEPGAGHENRQKHKKDQQIVFFLHHDPSGPVLPRFAIASFLRT